MHLAKWYFEATPQQPGVRPENCYLMDRQKRRKGRADCPVGAPTVVIPMTDRMSRLIGAKIFSGGFAKSFRSQGRGSGRSRAR